MVITARTSKNPQNPYFAGFRASKALQLLTVSPHAHLSVLFSKQHPYVMRASKHKTVPHLSGTVSLREILNRNHTVKLVIFFFVN